MNPRLLFVDDEPQILDSLRNLLRKHRRRWDMTFALGGEEALLWIAREPFDMVISDMRMPRVDGARVLAAAKDHLPSATRIILSGFSGLDAALRAVPVAQQFLSKPCDGETLLAVIERALKPRSSPRWARVLEIVGGLHRLPSPPATFRDLELVVANLMSITKDVSAVLATDPAMCAKTLQLANSAFFGLPHRVVRIDSAVACLGINTMRALVVTPGAFDGASSSKAARVEELQRHALRTAQIARALAGEDDGFDAISAAMLSDIGLNVLEERCGEELEEVRRLMEIEGLDRCAAEERVLGVHHAEVGAALLDIWGLPPDLVNAVALHHEAPLVARADATRTLTYVAAKLADAGPGPWSSMRGAGSQDPVPDVICAMGWEDRVARLLTEPEERAHG